MSELLTKEQIQAKADELSVQKNAKVIPLEFFDPETGEQVIGYIQEPSRMAKRRCIDKAATVGMSTAAEEMMGFCLIKEASSPRLYSDNAIDDKFVIGAEMECFKLLNVSQDQFKKK